MVCYNNNPAASPRRGPRCPRRPRACASPKGRCFPCSTEFSFRLLHNPPLDEITALFTRLRADGADSIAIIPHHYVSLDPGTPNLTEPPSDWQPRWFIWPDLGQDPTHPFHNTPEPELVLAACQAAAGLGLRVLLKPHIDSYQAAWRGDISVQARTADWVWGYRNRFLQRYIDIARQVDGAILSLGCELYTVTKELGPEFWIGLAEWVRGQGFRGALTYAANWGGWGPDAEYRRLADLWPHLDYIGVDAYFPLVAPGTPPPPDVAGLDAAWHRRGLAADWCAPIDDDLIALSRATGKPLLFTEIGYPNHQLAAEDPMRDPLPTDVRDDDLQLRLTQAFRQHWGGVRELSGYFWWEAFLDQAAKPPISHDILGQPIEPVVLQPLPGEPVAPPIQPPAPPPAPPPPTPAQVLAIHGVHGPNAPFTAFASQPGGPPEGAAAAWHRVVSTRASWIKLLAEDHTRADAAQAHALGLKVIVRAAGEAIVHWEDVLSLIQQYQGVCDVIEVGNEPFPTSAYPTWETLLWNHAFYLDAVLQHCAPVAHAAGIILCTPGWQAERDPPRVGTRLSGPGGDYEIDQKLATRLATIYGQFDAIGVHCYNVDVLAIDPIFAHIDAWHTAFPKPVYLTEYGIAGRFLHGVAAGDSDAVKAARYADFVRRLAALSYVRAACAFLLNGTPQFAAFNGGSYDPAGVNSYWLSETAWTVLGNTVATPIPVPDAQAGGTRGPDESGLRDLFTAGPPPHVGWADRPHGPDFPVAGVPTISPAVFAGVLQSHASPALQQGDSLDYYTIALQRGVNPAVALAFFEHESQCGTAGPVAAAGANNWGNLRPSTGGGLGRAVRKVTTPFGLFRGYNSYADSLQDWCDLLLGPLYDGKSIRAALQIYAPATDQNDPNSYASIVLRRIAEWDRASGEFDLPGTGPAVPPPPPVDFPLLAAPSIPEQTFTAALAAVQSPVLAEAPGADFFNLCVANGVDPAVALAFFQLETNCGTAPDAIVHQNWGNLWDLQANALGTYDRWLLGLRDWCARLQGPAYTKAGPPTIRSIVPIYRPALARRNGNDWYIDQLIQRIEALQAAPRALADVTFRALATPAQWIGASAGNYTVGRRGQKPIAVVNHEMQGTLSGTVDAFWNDAHQASAHYGVSKDGKIVQFVKEEDMAWANGPIRNPNLAAVPWIADVDHAGGNPNRLTISIEWEGAHEGTWGQVAWGGETFGVLQPGSVQQWWAPTDAQYAAGLELIRDICARWQIPFDRAHICRHSDFDAVTKWFCPGQGFPMQRILDELLPAPAPVPTPQPPAPVPAPLPQPPAPPAPEPAQPPCPAAGSRPHRRAAQPAARAGAGTSGAQARAARHAAAPTARATDWLCLAERPDGPARDLRRHARRRAEPRARRAARRRLLQPLRRQRRRPGRGPGLLRGGEQLRHHGRRGGAQELGQSVGSGDQRPRHLRLLAARAARLVRPPARSRLHGGRPAGRRDHRADLPAARRPRRRRRRLYQPHLRAHRRPARPHARPGAAGRPPRRAGAGAAGARRGHSARPH